MTIDKLMPSIFRTYVASIWYDISDLNPSRKTYYKTRELVVGDRAEKMAQDYLDGVETYEA